MEDKAREASAMTQSYEDRLRLAKVDAVALPVDLPDFTRTINPFTAEVLTYHGNRCPLYQDLLEWVEELKGRAIMNNQFEFSPAYLQQTLWKCRKCLSVGRAKSHGPPIRNYLPYF